MAASDETERSLRVQDKSNVRSFSCFDEILAGHSSCPIFCKVADLQKEMDFRGERIEQFQSDVLTWFHQRLLMQVLLTHQAALLSRSVRRAVIADRPALRNVDEYTNRSLRTQMQTPWRSRTSRSALWTKKAWSRPRATSKS